MAIVLNPRLYNQAKRHINSIYGSRTSAYRSMAIVKEYKRRGGKYAPAPSRSDGLIKWLREKWVVVSEFLKGKTVACGTIKRRTHACRPTVRVNATTPITIQETIEKHGPSVVSKLANAKSKGSNRARIDWKKGAYTTKKYKQLNGRSVA
jgi:hypothetical protein